MKRKRPVLILSCAILALAILGTAIYLFAVYLPEKRAEKEWQELFRTHYNNKVAQFAEENATCTPGSVDVVFLGDSLTEGYDLARYYPQYVTLNRGIGGDTSFGLEERLQVSVYDVQPKVAVMLIGANNQGTVLENYERILQGLRDNLPSTKIVLLSLTSMGGDWGHNNERAAYNSAVIQVLARDYGFSFVDLYTPLLNPETGEIFPEYTTDGGHLTPLGYEVLTAAITPAIEATLQPQKQQKTHPLGH